MRSLRDRVATFGPTTPTPSKTISRVSGGGVVRTNVPNVVAPSRGTLSAVPYRSSGANDIRVGYSAWGRVRILPNNGQAESLLGFRWLAWGLIVVPGGRIFSGQSWAIWLAGLGAVFFWLNMAPPKLLKGPLLTVPTKAIPWLGWSLLAAVVPLTPGWIALTAAAWVVILFGMYEQMWQFIVTAKFQQKYNPGQTSTVEMVEAPDEFDKWPKMKGSYWSGPLVTTATGTAREITLKTGMSARDAATDIDGWANFLSADPDALELEPVPGRGNRLTVLTHYQDFHQTPQAWPWQDAEHTDFYSDIPFAVTRNGKIVAINLVEQNVFLGGVPGGGKTVALNILVAAAALDPLVDLYCLDGKLSELTMWQDRAEVYVGDNVQEATAVLAQVEKEILARQIRLREMRLSKIHSAPAGMFRRIVVVIDELEIYTTASVKKHADEFERLLQRVGKLGRSAGVTLLVATQRPSKETVSQAVLATLQLRVSFRCSDEAQTRIIMGEETKHKASRIPAGADGRGKCYLNTDSRLGRTFLLNETDTWGIADRIPTGPKTLQIEPTPGDTQPRFPNGETIHEPWQAEAWNLLASDTYTINRLRAELTTAPGYEAVQRRLQAWQAEGWLDAGKTGNAGTWTRTEKENAA